MLIVDGNNVVGAAADGWWRDPPEAVRRLLARLQCYRARTDDEVVLVLDVPQPDLAPGDHDGVAVRYPGRRGRDAADERILELLHERGVEGVEGVELVTSDRALADEAAVLGASVVGSGTFLARMSRTGC